MIFFVSKIYFLSAHSYTLRKKMKNFLYNNFRCTEIDHILYLQSKLIFQHSGLQKYIKSISALS